VSVGHECHIDPAVEALQKMPHYRGLSAPDLACDQREARRFGEHILEHRQGVAMALGHVEVCRIRRQ
jgi:hypothetical protein